MAILGKFGLSGALDKVLVSGEIDAPAIAAPLKKLLENKKEVAEKVLGHLDTGPRVQYSTALKLLALLLDNSTIELTMRALPTYIPATQKDIATVLNTNKGFDPHLILPHLKDSLSLQIARDMILAHRKRFEAARLLRAVAHTRLELWEVIFELIHATADDAAFPEAVALTKNKNPVMRELATGVIAEFNNPAAIEVLQTLLDDNNHNVHAAALRGLARIKDSLPAAAIFELLKKTQKNEAPLIKALLSHCRDPELFKYINQAIFGKNTKLRVFAIENLASIMDKDNLQAVFLALSDKPESMHASIIQALLDHNEERFINAVSVLVNDEDKKIRAIAMKAVDFSDPNNPEIAEIILKSVDSKMTDELKTSFIIKLGEIRNKASVAVLIKLLSNDVDQRVAILQSLGNIGDPKALPAVFEMLAKDSADIQRAAIYCLGKLIPKQFARQIREELIDNIDKIHEEVLPNMGELLEIITDKYQLSETAAYTDALKKIQADISAELTMDSPMLEPGGDDPFGDSGEKTFEADEGSPFGGAADNPFGGATENPFGQPESDVIGAGETQATKKESAPEEDFAIELSPGKLLANRYNLVREIGRGGYGSVWLVEDTFVKEELVMKFLHQQLVSDEVAIERFIRELKMARKVTHTNIIRLFDYLDLGNIAAISMEYFPGISLASVIKEGTVEPARVVKLCTTVSHALEAAHQADVVHRDLKPANIMVDDDDTVKIVDFGIAAASKHAESRLTRTGTLVGTPTYISPESIQGKEVDGRTDMYSLGIIMYQMLSGEPPYQSEDSMALVFMHVEGKARRLEEVNPLVTKELADIVHRCIAPNPDDRYQTMAVLAQALSQASST